MSQDVVELNLTLNLSEGLSLPRAAATWVFAYLAKRGGGKTYNAAVQAEEMIAAGIPIVVIDGMGIFWGLRVGPEGKGPGLPVVVFGGEHADLPLTLETAAEIARAIVESNINAVIDVSEFSKTQSRKVVTAFLDELYRVNRVDRHVFIEESDMFAPQKPLGPEAVACLEAVDTFVRRGGNKNLGCTLITQRSAVLNKNILTQSDCLVVLRTKAPQDKEAVRAWIEENVDADNQEEVKKAEDMMKSLGTLKNGEAWVWHTDEPYVFAKFLFRRRKTFHATREFIKSPQAANIKLMDVGEFIDKFKSVFSVKLEQAKLPVNTSVDVSVYTAKIEELKQQFSLYQASKHQCEEELGAEIKSLKTELSDSKEYGKKITAEEAERCDQLEKAHRKLKAFENFRSALAELMPAPMVLDEAALTKLVGPALFEKFKGIAEDVAVKEMAKQLGQKPADVQDSAAVVSVTESLPIIEHKIEQPIVQFDESTNDGRLLTLVINGFFDEKRRQGETAKEIDRRFAIIVSNYKRDLVPAFEHLIQLKILQREEESGKNGWVYWLVDGAKDRIKEAS